MMKKYLRCVVVLLLAVAGGIACVYIYRSVLSQAVLKKQDRGNLSLVYTLLADEIQRNHIRVYTPEPLTSQSYSIDDFIIQVVQLRIDQNGNEFYLKNFARHNHQAVAMYACHIWDEKTLLAKFLLEMLYDVNPDARSVMNDYHAHGYLTTSREMVLRPQEAKWKWFTEEFLRQQVAIDASQLLPSEF